MTEPIECVGSGSAETLVPDVETVAGTTGGTAFDPVGPVPTAVGSARGRAEWVA